MKEHKGKHGILALGESRLIGEVISVRSGAFDFQIDGSHRTNNFSDRDGWVFVPDLPETPKGKHAIVVFGTTVYVRTSYRVGWNRTLREEKRQDARIKAGNPPIMPRSNGAATRIFPDDEVQSKID